MAFVTGGVLCPDSAQLTYQYQLFVRWDAQSRDLVVVMLWNGRQSKTKDI